MDVAAWLRGLGLERYEAAFRENDIDAAVLPGLTGDDLRELGVASVGHRRRLLDAIAALPGDGTAPHRPGQPAAAPPTRSSPSAAAAPAGAERRHLTVLFADLADSTALSARLDPEDMRDVVTAYHRCVAAAVEGQGGYVAKYMGDGVLAYFGWPRAQEDDAERAVRAGLAAVAAVRLLPGGAGGPLAARVGIATGPAVVGDVVGEGLAQERGVVGETPNLAARLQALAAAGAVVADSATRRLTGTLLAWEDLGDIPLKGFAAPVRAARAMGESGIESRFEGLRTPASLAPLVGRDEDLEILLRRWRRARDGEGQVVLLRGEPGIGKSRLTAALRDALAGEPHEELVWFCSPQHTDRALHPIITRLGRAAGIVRDDAPEVRLAKLEALLAQGDAAPEEVDLIADLLILPTAGRHPLPDLAPQLRRERTLAALLRRVEALARRRPVLALLEDAHWADPTTRDLLDLVVARAPALPLLLVVTHRPEFEAGGWVGQSQVTALQLSRLGRRDNAALVGRVAGGKALPPEVLEEIVARTDGVPLFTEEMTRAVLEGGLMREEAERWVLDGPLRALTVPATLQASLMARLDRLAPVREVVQVGAAIGREFPYDLLAAAAEIPHERLREALGQLVSADLVRARGAAPAAVYTFKHALVQDAAYESLLRERRQGLHLRIAGAIERLRPEALTREPQLLAHHWAQAGEAERAVTLYIEAAEQALARAALGEAEAILLRGLEMLPRVRGDVERARAGVDLWVLRARALTAAKGFAAGETADAVARAHELSERADDPERRYRALAGRFAVLAVRGELRASLDVARLLVGEARERGDAGAEQGGLAEAGYTLLLLGRPLEARAHLEAAVALGGAPAGHRFSFGSEQAAPVASQAYLGVALLGAGEADRAAERSEAAVAAARELGHAFTLANTLSVGIRVAFLRRDAAAVDGWLGELLSLCEDKGFAYHRAVGRVYVGWRSMQRGALGEAAAPIRDGLDVYRATGACANIPWFLAVLAEAQAAAGDAAAGLATLTEGLELVEATELREWQAELLRLRGAILLGSGDPARAEHDLRHALSVAGEQGARWWALRSATCLARLWRDRGHRDEARALLAPVYARFTEGFAMPDLVRARVLLDQLGSSPATRAGEGATQA